VDDPATRLLAPPSRWRTAGLGWLALTAVAIAAFAPLKYVTGPLPAPASTGDVFAAHFAGLPAWGRAALYAHIVPAALALLLSPLQFSRRVRARAPRVHRLSGRVVVGSIVAGGTAGLVLAPTSLAGPVGTAGFGSLALLWVAFALAGVRAIRAGDVAAHRRCMVRAFALTYAGVTLRLWLPLLTQLTGGDLLAAYAVVPFLCWVPNLVLAEALLRRGPNTGGGRTP
jgi:uncharacterized membrane protein